MDYQPRIEEVSDSDPEEMDIEAVAPAVGANTMMNPSNIPMQARPQAAPVSTREAEAAKRARTNNWQCLYPLYFDASRTLKEGRRVSKELAVRNPLAREILEAVHSLGLDVAFEADKSHPKDWSNPGRVKTLIKEDGRIVRGHISNKHHLFVEVAKYLKDHPTTKSTPLKLRIPGMPPQTKPLPPPAVPRGWRMSKVLPLHSPAVTGGGVSDNLFEQMQKEMTGQSDDSGASAIKPKKEKKKIKG